MTVKSFFSDVPFTPGDPIFELTAAFHKDESPDKINLGQGMYRGGDGKAWILPAVREAEKIMTENHPGHDYLPIHGLPAFRNASAKVIFGESSPLLAEKRVATIQTISGTGAVHIAAAFLKQFHQQAKVYVPNPSWSNHRIMFEYVGFEVLDYGYYDAVNKAVDFDAFRKDLESAAPGSIFVLHACAHNPTGCDLTQDEWREVGAIMSKRRLVPVLDSAYQGFASGDLDRDAFSIRHLLEDLGLPGLVCQSFAKSMGLYGERVGALHVSVAPGAQGAIPGVESQLGWILRKEMSNCGRYGATIAATVINTPELYAQWREDLVTMSSRIQSMRQRVVDRLTEYGTPGTWDHVTRQIGMFSYTGIPKDKVLELRERHIYMADNGRASVAGLNEHNVEYFCKSVHEVMRGSRLARCHVQPQHRTLAHYGSLTRRPDDDEKWDKKASSSHDWSAPDDTSGDAH